MPNFSKTHSRIDIFLFLGIVVFALQQLSQNWNSGSYYLNLVVLVIAAVIIRRYISTVEEISLLSWGKNNIQLAFGFFLTDGLCVGFFFYSALVGYIGFWDAIGATVFVSYVIAAFLLLSGFVLALFRKIF